METVDEDRHRTIKQNRAMHGYFRSLAYALNSAGLDMRTVLKPGVAIDWNEVMIKDYIWRPIQKVITGEKSTADLTTTDIDAIYQVISRHMAEKFGVSVAFPDRFSMAEERY